jgi:hypothetical protein
MIWRENFLA